MSSIEVESIIRDVDSSFRVMHLQPSDLLKVNDIHIHPEYEIIYIPQGSGKRFVGSKMSTYDDGELLLLGPNIPHIGYKDSLRQGHWQTVIQFDPVIFESLMDLSETAPLRKLLKRAQSGIIYQDPVKHKFGHGFKNLSQKTGFDRLFFLLNLLKDLSTTGYYQTLDYDQNYDITSSKEQTRFSLVFTYIKDRYKKEPTLKEVAKLAAMHPSAFCRFLKKHTQKTFVQLVNEYRIRQSCILLMESKLNISEIGYESGFDTLSYFNKKFRELMKMSPSQYRQLYGIK